jgi:hypothetical protein
VKCVVPLAGPDLLHPVHGLRPLFPVDGQPLLATALDGRSWRTSLAGEDYIFVVREVAGIETLVSFLEARWPGCRMARLSHPTEGSMMSALAGVALAAGEEPVIVDLADILFDADLGAAPFAAPDVGAVVPCFRSSEPCYSYLRREAGRVVEAAEKRVISDEASAGAYVFRNRQVFWRAAAHAIDNAAGLTHLGAFFVCPMVNGVIAQGLEVLAPIADRVRPIGKLFHKGSDQAPEWRL